MELLKQSKKKKKRKKQITNDIMLFFKVEVKDTSVLSLPWKN